MIHSMQFTLCVFGMTVALSAVTALADERDIVFADFEQPTYGEWQVTGDAFGPGPAHGTLPHQMPVDGYDGQQLVNSYFNGDATRGRLTSPEFVIERNFISFLIGGGGIEEQTCMNLIVSGKPVRSAVGPNTAPGGSERLERGGWDVTEFKGQRAHLEQPPTARSNDVRNLEAARCAPTLAHKPQ